MKLLFGLAVAILVLATTLEVVNADGCPPGYTLDNDGDFCYRVGGDDVYAAAVADCEADGGRLSTPAELDELEGEIDGNKHYWLPAFADDDCDVGAPGSAVTDRVDCNCELPYFYVCVIEVCPENYDYDPELKCCFRVCGPGTYQEALDACAAEGATVTTAVQLDILEPQLDGSEHYWIPGINGSCDVASPGSAVDDPMECNCNLPYLYVCVWCEDWLDNDDNCVCTLHDDPLLKTCDNATIKIIGENQGFRFTKSSEYADEKCNFHADFYLGAEQALIKVFIQMKDTKIWMYDNGIRVGNENAQLDSYMADPVFHQPLNTAGNSGNVQEGDITITFDGAENLATFTSTHCEIQFEFRASPNPILRATIGEKYDNDLKWLCGDFNGNMIDDYRIANGVVVYDDPDRYPQISNYASKNNLNGLDG